MNLDDETLRKYMKHCMDLTYNVLLSLARPYVGAIVVTLDGRIIGKGYRSYVPDTNLLVHAERMAITRAQENVRSATLFTTLEPCPPDNRTVKGRHIFKSCCELIIDEGIVRVVVGAVDNSSSVRKRVEGGCGIRYLQQHGIQVIRYTGLERVILDQLVVPHAHFKI